jgi:hypothetical protein
MLVELCLEYQLFLSFESDISGMAILESQLDLFVFSVVALDIFFVDRL